MQFLASIFFLSVLIIITFIDIDHHLIPNKIILPAIPVMFVLSLLVDFSRIWMILTGGLIGGVFLLILALIWPGGMGGGDIKLAAFIGLALGLFIIEALFLAFFLGATVGILMIIVGKKNRKDLMPFGPFLAFASFITLFWGQKLASYYINLF